MISSGLAGFTIEPIVSKKKAQGQKVKEGPKEPEWVEGAEPIDTGMYQQLSDAIHVTSL